MSRDSFAQVYSLPSDAYFDASTMESVLVKGFSRVPLRMAKHAASISSYFIVKDLALRPVQQRRRLFGRGAFLRAL